MKVRGIYGELRVTKRRDNAPTIGGSSVPCTVTFGVLRNDGTDALEVEIDGTRYPAEEILRLTALVKQAMDDI